MLKYRKLVEDNLNGLLKSYLEINFLIIDLCLKGKIVI